MSGPFSEMNRREFLRVSGKAALAAGFGPMLLAGGGRMVFADGEDCGDVAVWGLDLNGPNARREGETDAELFDRIRPSFDRRLREAIAAVDDLSWARPGKKVGIKIACNSPRPYPKTTHPLLLESTIKMLIERGCEVIVSDHPGGEWIAPALLGNDRKTEKIRELYAEIHRVIFGDGAATGDAVLRMNGLLDVITRSGARYVSLDGAREARSPEEIGDDDTWVWVKPGRDEGVVAPTRVWPKGYRVARVFFDVDHVVNLARPSAHIMAGHTGPLKTWYGWLHILDRFASHADGFFYPFALEALRKKQRWLGWLTDFFPPEDFDEVPHLHESIAEVAAFFDRKVELNVVAAIETFADIGPDWGAAPLEQSTIMASKDLTAIDAAHAAQVNYEKKRLGPDALRASWARDPEVSEWQRRRRDFMLGNRETLRDETFWGDIEGLMHRKHGSHITRELIEQGTATGKDIWDTRMLAHAVKNGASDCARFKLGGTPLAPTLLAGLRGLTKARVAEGLEDALREGARGDGQDQDR